MLKYIFTFFVFYFLIPNSVLANNQIEFSEISFKDTKSDWIELKNNSAKNSSIQIKNAKFTIEIDPSKILNKKFILIHLKSASNKELTSKNTYEIFIKNKTLKNTEDEICLYVDKIKIECVCWSKEKASCSNSSKIKQNQSIIKESAWQKINSPTPGEINGQSSSKIKINEIFPNPKGSDKNREWLELINQSANTVNLLNWTIKGKHLNQKIKANSTLVIQIPLTNTQGSIDLKDFKNHTIDQVTYKNASEGLSYANVNSKWIWTMPSKNKGNPKLKSKNGYITNKSPLEINYHEYKTQIPEELISTLKIGQSVNYLADELNIYELKPLNKTFLLHYIVHHLHKLTPSNLVRSIKQS